jgi:nucleotide-binding universal stress UspA family protein
MSTYATVMVALDLGHDVVARTELATNIADRFDAHLIGVAGGQLIATIVSEAGFTGGIPVDTDENFASEELENIETAFRQGVGSFERVSIRTEVEEPSTFLLRQARAADLLIVGRQDRPTDRDWRLAVDPGDIVLQAGRPVLVTPPRADYVSAERVLVAWNDTREARRAVWDALPFLRRAEEVFICAVGDEIRYASARDVQNHLDHHGVAAEVLGLPRRSATVGDEIIQAAERVGADLIVSGAYGHSRMREWVFGGVTCDLLEHAPMCCLMTH